MINAINNRIMPSTLPNTPTPNKMNDIKFEIGNKKQSRFTKQKALTKRAFKITHALLINHHRLHQYFSGVFTIINHGETIIGLENHLVLVLDHSHYAIINTFID